jgi:phage FluMu protein Com
VVNIDQRANFHGGKITQSVTGSGSVRCTSMVQKDARIPGSQIPVGPPLSAIERSRCPRCQTLTTLAGIAPGPAGYEFRTFECPKCDRVLRTLAAITSSPSQSEPPDWFDSNLYSPTK